MKKCVVCDGEFDTPGIQCQSCRDRVLDRFYYHGTTLDRLDAILSEGVSCNVARTYRSERPEALPERVIAGREDFFQERADSTFLASTALMAAGCAFQGVIQELENEAVAAGLKDEFQARGTRNVRKMAPETKARLEGFILDHARHLDFDGNLRVVALKIDVPRDVKLIRDEFGYPGKGMVPGVAYRIVGDVPPVWIMGYHKYAFTNGQAFYCGHTRIERTDEGMREITEGGEEW